MQKKIGYDARMIENSGIGIRIQHILKFWPIAPTDAKLYIFGDPNHLKKYEIPHHAEIIEYKTKIYSPKEFFGHPKMTEMDVLDIPHFNVPLKYIRKCIVTIHDLIPYHFKETHSSFAKRMYLQLVLRSIKWFAKTIIAVSNYTKNDLITNFSYARERITVVYNGIDLKNFSNRSQTQLNVFIKQQKLPKQYLFTVGIGKTHKNFPFLLNNLQTLWNAGTLKLPLVVGGISKEIPAEFIEFQKQNPNRIYFLEHLSYDRLPLAYQGAKLFVYPSLFEGFGFPVLEAQAVGTPVFSSDASVLPEVLGKGFEAFSPKNSSSFQNQLLMLIKDKKRLKELSRLGKENAKSFTWSFAIKSLDVLYKKQLTALK
ncbi:glycosyltransferase family 4 protein [Leptospira sp. WS39.C2]